MKYRIHQPVGARSVPEQLADGLSLAFHRVSLDERRWTAESYGGTKFLLERAGEDWELTVVEDPKHKLHSNEQSTMGPFDDTFLQTVLPDCLVGVVHG